MLPILLATLEGEADRMRFAALYRAVTPELYRYALALVGAPLLAEEALQETWVRCIRHVDTLFAIPPEEQLPWLSVVVRHLCWDLLEKEGRHLPLEDWAPVSQPDPQQGDADAIVAIIRAMPPQYREILEMKFVLEWSDKEIAHALRLSPNAVRTRIWRGRKLLQDKLREEGFVNA